MKKSLVALTMLVGISWGNAQVGINTSAPKATLHVGKLSTAKTTAEGVLIPRVTVSDLDNKSSLYSANQNGALVFVTSTTVGTGTTTSSITGRGFYYFNGTTLKWVSATPSSNAYGTGGGSFTPSYLSVTLTSSTTSSSPQNVGWSTYTNQYNYFEFNESTSASGGLYYIDFPSASDFQNKTIYLRSNVANSSSSGVKFASVPTDLSHVGNGIAGLKGYSTLRLYSDGANWYLMNGNFSFN